MAAGRCRLDASLHPDQRSGGELAAREGAGHGGGFARQAPRHGAGLPLSGLEKTLGQDYIRDDAPSSALSVRKWLAGRFDYMVVPRTVLDKQVSAGRMPPGYHVMTVYEVKTMCAVSRKSKISVADFNSAIEALDKAGELPKILAALSLLRQLQRAFEADIVRCAAHHQLELARFRAPLQIAIEEGQRVAVDGEADAARLARLQAHFLEAFNSFTGRTTDDTMSRR
jgi:hypothetical protein